MLGRYLSISLFACLAFSSCTNRTDRPNVLFIITDDQSWLHCGAYGDQSLQTPNIDHLSKKGVKFNNTLKFSFLKKDKMFPYYIDK